MIKDKLPSGQLRLVLLISILASFVAFLDGSVVNVALPAIMRDLGGGFAVQQWVVDAYLITLGALILVAGSFSDIFGRKRILFFGLAGFAAASLLCAIAPNGSILIGARAVQGIAGALLVPSSLALITSAYSGPAQGNAIGMWTAWTGIAFIVGPLLGGLLVDALSWRWIFAINVVPVALTLWLLTRLQIPSKQKESLTVDITGAILCALGLGGIVYALIEQERYGWASPNIYVTLMVGAVMFGYFIWHEAHTPSPMLPLKLFTIRNFGVGNLATAAIYAGLSAATFLIIVFVQQVGKYTALEAGLALMPVTILMFLLSPRVGVLSSKLGPRWFMAVGPFLCSAGILSMLRVESVIGYWSQLFPGAVLFGLGLSITVAPLTAAVLGSIESRHAGIGSAINNAVSRIAGLIAIAMLGVAVGPNMDMAGFRRGMFMIAGLLMMGSVISAIGIRNRLGVPMPLMK